MDQTTYDRFKELRQAYYLAGRSLMVNQLFGMAGINLGYCIELSLKFALIFKGVPTQQQKKHVPKSLKQHHIDQYYKQVVDAGLVPPLSVSRDFLRFATERLNSRSNRHN